jgi:hypothetical protein
MPTMIQTDPPRPARETLPTMYDLPSEEVGDADMPDEYHVHQATRTSRRLNGKCTSVFCACRIMRSSAAKARN